MLAVLLEFSIPFSYACMLISDIGEFPYRLSSKSCQPQIFKTDLMINLVFQWVSSALVMEVFPGVE